MALEKKLIYGFQARTGILNGIRKCGRAVSSTFGPKGKLYVVWKGTTPYSSRDGMKCLQSITFRDELENIGASLMKEASTKANLQNGDGSTTVALLTAALCEEANSLMSQGVDQNDVRLGFNTALEDVITEISKMKVESNDEDSIRKVARVSSHGDDEIADIVTKAFMGIGDNGVVAVTDSLSRKGKSDVVFSTGCDFEGGFLSRLSVNTKSDTFELNRPLVLISSKKWEAFEDLVPFLQHAQTNDRSIVLVAPDYADSCVAGFNGNLSKKSLSGAMIYTPGVNKNDVNDRARDLAVLLGAKILHEDVVVDEWKFDEHFGGCERMIISSRKTEVIEPDTDEEEFKKHVEELKAKITLDDVDEAYSEFEIEKIKERLAHMEGGVATIKVGALTQVDLDEKKDRYDDAVNAVRASIQEGVIPGGGSALLQASFTLEDSKRKMNTGSKLSYEAFLHAVMSPFKVLVSSCGKTPEWAMMKVSKSKKDTVGFDARNEEVVDMIEKGIVDSLKIVMNDLRYATSVAETFMLIDVAIISDLGSVSIKNIDEALRGDDYFGGIGV